MVRVQGHRNHRRHPLGLLEAEQQQLIAPLVGQGRGDRPLIRVLPVEETAQPAHRRSLGSQITVQPRQPEQQGSAPRGRQQLRLHLPVSQILPQADHLSGRQHHPQPERGSIARVQQAGKDNLGHRFIRRPGLQAAEFRRVAAAQPRVRILPHRQPRQGTATPGRQGGPLTVALLQLGQGLEQFSSAGRAIAWRRGQTGIHQLRQLPGTVGGRSPLSQP